MSGNKLLKENTIRRFMKLANVGGLSDKFISEMSVSYKDEDDDKVQEEGMYKDEDEKSLEEQEAPEEEEELELDMADEPGDDMDLDMSDDMEDSEMGAADISLTEEEAQLLIDLGERLSAAMDEDAAGSEDAMDPMADMEDMGDSEPEGVEPPADLDDEEKDEIMQEVLRRVTKRLLSSRKG